MSRRLRLLALLSLLALPFAARAANDTPGAVFTLNNAASGNRVVMFHRNAHGELSPAGSFATGGLGTGAGLGSQGALALTANGQWLLAVNAGSNEVSVFSVRNDTLVLADVVPSHGVQPTSVTVADNLVYVLNAGGAGNISGFYLSQQGELHAVPGSTQPLSGAATAPAQVSFGLRGDVLIVTERATSRIDSFVVDADGRAGPVSFVPSSGATPFGFAISSDGFLFVSEAVASALSSYALDANGGVDVVTPSLVNHQGAACWVVLSKNGKYAYTANATTDNLSGYHVARDGSLTLFDDGGATAPANRPLDLAVSGDGRFLYALEAATGSVSGYRIDQDGSLAMVTRAGALPNGAAGLVAK